MRAILLCEKNKEDIAQTKTLSSVELDEMIREYGDTTPHYSLYFIPDYNLKTEVTWALLPFRMLSQNYEYPAHKIDTEFVELTPTKNL